MKKFLSAAALALAMTAPQASAADYGIPDDIQAGNILHCFDWTFNDIKNELPNIAAAGFGAIQVSPVQGNCATNAEWFYAYMPYDFTFKANGNGSREQLKSLCQAAANYNIKIVVDVVANHVNQASGYHDKWWDSNGRVRWNGGVDYNNRYSITHNQLGEYGDVNSEASEVQSRAKAFLEDLKSIGVKGIRWDAAKHIGLPSESCNFWSQMASVAGLWHYGEILDGPGGDKYTLLKEYAKYIGVTDSEYSKWTLEQVERGNVPTGHGSWTPNGVPANKVVYWAESHDDYSNDGQYGKNTALISQDKMDRAYAIVACRNNEAALYFSRPAATTRNAIKMGQKGSTHFTTKEVAEVNKFRNAMNGTDDYFSASNGVACITRKGGGAVIVIGAGGSRNVSVANGGSYVPAGTYKDQVSGNTFTVTPTTISGQVGSTGIAVVYNPNGVVVPDPNPTPDPDPTPDPTPDGAHYVYYDGTFSAPQVWAWTDAGNCTVATAWPGDNMTKKNGKWYWEVPAGKSVPTGIIIHEGDNKIGGGNLVYVDKATYHQDGSYTTGTTPDPDPTPDPTPGNMPSQLYILGNLAGAQWNTAAGVQMTKSGSTFKADNVTFEAAAGETKCYFNLTDALGADWDVVNMNANRYGATTEGAPVSIGTSAPMKLYANNIDASACMSWTVGAGVYTVIADFSNMTLTVTKPSGIEDIEADGDCTPVYYNLQGVRVEEPSAGLYIRVTGNKVEKVLVK